MLFNGGFEYSLGDAEKILSSARKDLPPGVSVVSVPLGGGLRRAGYEMALEP